jgi:hypothetical protein
MHTDVYRVLSNNADSPVVRQLRGSSCIHVGQGRFVDPATAFWQPSPFGRWGTTLPETWLPYKAFFDAVGVKQEAGPAEVAAILRSILREYGTDPLDENASEAVHGCWTRLSALLDHPEAPAVLAATGRIRSTLDPRGLLARPDELYFEDSRALHKRFPQLAHNVIARVQGTWPALTQAGVRRVEDLIKAKLVDVSADLDVDLPTRIADRRSALQRVFDNDDILEDLQHLQVLRASAINLKYRAELFGYSYEIGPEPVDAIYVSDEDALYYAEGASARALARELARAIAPDDDPGPIAMRLEPVLSAGSIDEAHLALDDYGIAKLDVSDHDVEWTPSAEPGDITPPPEDDDWSEDEEEGQDAEQGTPPSPQDSGGGDPGNQEQQDGDDQKQSGGGGGGSSGGKTSRRSRKSVGGTDPRTGRQTRLRSYVVESDEDEGDRGTVGDEAPDLSPIDMAGVARVLDYERSCGREPKEMAHSNAGFDVESFDKRGELVRRIEIKSTGGPWSIAGVMLSRRQHQQALTDTSLFWLYVVENAQDETFKIYRIQDPASRIDYFGFDGGWKDVAEPDIERDPEGTPTAATTRSLLSRSPGQGSAN